MKITSQLIEQFLIDQCTPEEAEAVYQYFKRQPGKLEDYLPEAEWQRFTSQDRNTKHTPTKHIVKKLPAVYHLPTTKSKIPSLNKWTLALYVVTLIATVTLLYVKCTGQVLHFNSRLCLCRTNQSVTQMAVDAGRKQSWDHRSEHHNLMNLPAVPTLTRIVNTHSVYFMELPEDLFKKKAVPSMQFVYNSKKQPGEAIYRSLIPGGGAPVSQLIKQGTSPQILRSDPP